MSTENAMSAIAQYVADVSREYRAGNATEHTYRPALKSLLENMTAGFAVTNEPKRIECGAPDFIVTRNEIPVGYIEAKDIGADLNGKAHKAQFDRYRQSLDSLIITDYLTFQLFEGGEPVTSVTIGKIGTDDIKADKTQFQAFAALIDRFLSEGRQGIKTAAQLAKVMAAKARLMANVIEGTVDSIEPVGRNSLTGQLQGFREVLIPDISNKEFADVYSQTIAYGMFAASLNDSTDEVFTRSKASKLIPLSNPFLRQLFYFIAGVDLDKRICWIVDDLADLFNHVDIDAISNEFSKADHDPMVHFYETFLAEYDPALRKSRGVWYTPQPVVQFIVQAVDDILVKDFKLPQGLADISKVQRNGKMLHRVQILDPATGTGTFLAEVVERIHQQFKNQQGAWQNYVGEHLLPRVHGFEILMASYVMAHLKMDMVLRRTGYNPSGDNERLRIFLTNSLEGEKRETPSLPFIEWLVNEANEANRVKQDVPVMVVLGNPPYSGKSQNNGKWICDLINDYKKEPSGEKLRERNSKWLNDDYVKFIRYGQHFIEKNGEGVLAFITNHSFLDNITFRGMRYRLLKSFDTIYFLNLHGDAKKMLTVTDADGNKIKDENVFDIQQGVSINIFVKTRPHYEKDHLATVYHFDLYGTRSGKYNFLSSKTLNTINWRKLSFSPLKENKLVKENYGGILDDEVGIHNDKRGICYDEMNIDHDNDVVAEAIENHFFFAQKDLFLQTEYEQGFSVKDLFPMSSMGITTADDARLVNFIPFEENNQVYSYRALDTRYINYDLKKVHRHRYELMKHFLRGENVALCFIKVGRDYNFSVFVTNQITDKTILSSKDNASVFPLYRYPEGYDLMDAKNRKPNLNDTIVNEISQRLGLQFFDVGVNREDVGLGPTATVVFGPIDILDYIYAVLHSPAYRDRYMEFLKIDFPYVPYPKNEKQFWRLVELGEKLRHLHLLEDVEPIDDLANFPIPGSCEVETLRYVNRKVYINDTQYFDNVPPQAWEFYIGGYQPAQKWLKDRKGRKLTYDDVRHYQRIILVLQATRGIMKEIDSVE